MYLNTDLNLTLKRLWKSLYCANADVFLAKCFSLQRFAIHCKQKYFRKWLRKQHPAVCLPLSDEGWCGVDCLTLEGRLLDLLWLIEEHPWQLDTFSESQLEMSCLREVEMVSYLSIHLFSKMADWRHYLVLFAWVPGVRKKEHHNSRAFKTTGCAQSVHNKAHMFRSVARLDALTSKSSVLARNYTDEISYWIAYYFNSWTDIDRF